MAQENEDRNRELIYKRLDDPKKWTFAELGVFYHIHRSTAEKIFNTHIEKYATKKQVARYEKMLVIYA